MPTSYTTLAELVQAEIEVRRSRFLARAEPVADEEAARAVVESARRAHHDARHHCSAFILGADRRTERSNDDGEPAGTAGSPMLDVLRGSGYTDVVVVVTRWFGGTLLGTGGLIRAYSDAVEAALHQATPRRRELRRRAHLDVPIADVGRVENQLRSHGLDVTGTDYGVGASPQAAALARLHLALIPDTGHEVAAVVAAVTSGRATLVPTDEVDWVDVAQPGD